MKKRAELSEAEMIRSLAIRRVHASAIYSRYIAPLIEFEMQSIAATRGRQAHTRFVRRDAALSRRTARS